MSILETFPANSTAVVIGATGGIGSALTAALRRDGRIGTVYALSRGGDESKSGALRTGNIDITDESSVQSAAERCGADGSLELVIVASGVLHRGDEIRPEKRMAELTSRAMLSVLEVNAVGPALVAKHFLPRMRRDAKSVFAAISARVGSTGDNRLGGWLSYRASKAALNMAIRTLAIEQSRARPNAVVVTLHPGTVDTSLSAPFQRGVPEGKLFSPAYAAEQLLCVLNGLTSADTGGFFAWDGSKIEY